MTAESDIAVIDDGGESTAAEVRTALTSVLARADVLTLIERQVLTETTATFDFTSIPADFENLKLVVQARSSHSAAVNMLMRFNADSGSNYNWQYFDRINTTSGGSNATGQTSGIISNIQGTDATANKATLCETIIGNYKRTTFHKFYFAHSSNWVSGAPTIINFAGNWNSTVAITQVTLLPGTGSFIAGSVASLYGMG